MTDADRVGGSHRARSSATATRPGTCRCGAPSSSTSQSRAASKEDIE